MKNICFSKKIKSEVQHLIGGPYETQFTKILFFHRNNTNLVTKQTIPEYSKTQNSSSLTAAAVFVGCSFPVFALLKSEFIEI